MQVNQPPGSVIQELTLDAPVSIVTLLEDRAQVRRIDQSNFTPGLLK